MFGDILYRCALSSYVERSVSQVLVSVLSIRNGCPSKIGCEDTVKSFESLPNLAQGKVLLLNKIFLCGSFRFWLFITSVFMAFLLRKTFLL